jgi:hypothetical protein
MQVIAVETAQIQGMQSVIIQRDGILNAVADGAKPTPYVGEDWKFRFLHLGVRPVFSFHFYDTDDTPSGQQSGYSLDFAVTLALQINQHFSLQTELLFGEDSMKAERSLAFYDEYDNFLFNHDTTQSFSSQYLLVPLLAKATWRPSVFSLEVLGGLYFSVPTGEVKREDSFLGTTETGTAKSLMGLVGGGSLGMKIGPGLVYVDARYLIDFTKTSIEMPSFSSDIYRRSMVSIGIGYSIGFFSMNGGNK